MNFLLKIPFVRNYFLRRLAENSLYFPLTMIRLADRLDFLDEVNEAKQQKRA